MVRAPSVDKNGMKKGAWSKEEDNKLRAYVQRYGHWNWRQLPRFAGLNRCGKSCRLRWENYLKPGVRRGNYSPEEEELIMKLHQELGNKWSVIASKLPGRTDNDIKNHWHTHLRKKAESMHGSKSTNHQEPVERSQHDTDRPADSDQHGDEESSSSSMSIEFEVDSTQPRIEQMETNHSNNNINNIVGDSVDHTNYGEVSSSSFYDLLMQFDWTAGENGMNQSVESIMKYLDDNYFLTNLPLDMMPHSSYNNNNNNNDHHQQVYSAGATDLGKEIMLPYSTPICFDEVNIDCWLQEML